MDEDSKDQESLIQEENIIQNEDSQLSNVSKGNNDYIYSQNISLTIDDSRYILLVIGSRRVAATPVRRSPASTQQSCKYLSMSIPLQIFSYSYTIYMFFISIIVYSSVMATPLSQTFPQTGAGASQMTALVTSTPRTPSHSQAFNNNNNSTSPYGTSQR